MQSTDAHPISDALLEELLPADRACIEDRLDYEKRHWRASSIWWRKADTVELRQMQQWCQKFMRFRGDLLRRKRPCMAAFKQWLGGATDMNVPQSSFYGLLAQSMYNLNRSRQEAEQL